MYVWEKYEPTRWDRFKRRFKRQVYDLWELIELAFWVFSVAALVVGVLLLIFIVAGMWLVVVFLGAITAVVFALFNVRV